jgi:hypothetical protein
MDWNSLSPAQRTSLADILASSCSLTDINRAIGRSFNAGDSLDVLTVRRSDVPEKRRFRAQVGELVSLAHEIGRLGSFVYKILEIKIGYAAFRNLSDMLTVAGSTVSVSGEHGFEFQSAANRLGIVDFEALLERLAAIKEATCRFVLSGPAGERSLGTGVLVGEDLILTNHHVLKDYISPTFRHARPPPPPGLGCQFDYSGPKRQCVTVPLVANQDWLVGVSPEDAVANANANHIPVGDGLDYALVRLARFAPPAGGRPRAFETPPSGGTFRLGMPIIVVQYPGQDRLSASFGTTIAMNENATRLTYDADTMGGTSGSGVYRLPDCAMISLHQGGNPGAGYNQGIPISLILAHLHRGRA